MTLTLTVLVVLLAVGAVFAIVFGLALLRIAALSDADAEDFFTGPTQRQ
jgi:hypothetical protein